MRIAERWFDHEDAGDGVVRIWEAHVDPLLRANLWLVRGRDRDLLVDTGLGIASLREGLARLLERPVSAVATHRHYDHVGGLHEFEEILAHAADAPSIAAADGFASLVTEDFTPEELHALSAAGYPPPASGVLIDALPHEGYDPRAYRVVPATPTRIVEEGDVIDLGNRTFEVLHLPGHTPGSIGLWEAETATLFSGDCVYESGELLDELPESDIASYLESMRRLRDLPVTIVHGGHDPSFGRRRLLQLIDEYLERRAPS